jgi:hypothetical protein
VITKERAIDVKFRGDKNGTESELKKIVTLVTGMKMLKAPLNTCDSDSKKEKFTSSTYSKDVI